MDLSIVVPVFNEAGTIEKLVDDLALALPEVAKQFEVLIVDDASTDETSAILQRLADERSWLHVERADRNAGHGPSVIRGLDGARAEWILQIDSDGQFVVAELALLWAARDTCDVALGVRVLRHDPRHRLLLTSRRPPGDIAPWRQGAARRQHAVPARAPGSLGRPPAAHRPRDARPEHLCFARSDRARLARRRGAGDAPAPRDRHGEPPHAEARALQPARACSARRVPRATRAHDEPRAGGSMTRLPAAVARPLGPTVRRLEAARARAWVASWWREAAPFATLAVVGLSLRLVQLGAKPFHHDESLHAWFGWRLATGEGYAYDPVYHGPVQFYLVALVDLLFGAGRLRQPHPGRGRRQRRGLPALLSPPPARHGCDADRLRRDLPRAELPLLLTLPA